jgi:uncharacterized membrane-anchored protein
MKQEHVPLAGARYWVALSIASVFGANMGDFVARYLHLGHAGGLLPLAAMLAVVFVAERRDRSPHQWYYWLAIIIVRTAATNLADLGASDFKLGKIGLTIGLSIVLVLALLLSPPSKAAEATDTRVFRLPITDAKYWAAMFIAGTLGRGDSARGRHVGQRFSRSRHRPSVQHAADRRGLRRHAPDLARGAALSGASARGHVDFRHVTVIIRESG